MFQNLYCEISSCTFEQQDKETKKHFIHPYKFIIHYVHLQYSTI